MYRAIIIDDDQWALADMKRCFHFEDYGFVLAGTYCNAEDALADILADPPELIVSDICMESSSGIDLARICRENGIDTMIVLVSGYDDFAYVQEAFRWGVFQYLLKPLDDEKVTQVMRRAQKKLAETQEPAVMGGDIVQQTLQLIESQYMETEFRLELAANEIHVNKSHLSEMFRQKIGMTFTDYKNLVRIRHAKEMIRSGRVGMMEIAQSVGFDSASYFSRIFKHYAGVTPQEFRKQMESTKHTGDEQQ